MLTDNKLVLNGTSLSIEDLVTAGRRWDVTVEVHPDCWDKIARCRALVDKYAAGEKCIYGVNTSCGGLVNYLLPKESDHEFQQNLVRCVTTQVGPLLPDELVRTTMIARTNSLCRGLSGIKPENLRIYIDMINKHVVPCIPQLGSLGASGDLGPLGCIAAVAFGEWKAHFKGEEFSGKDAMEKAGIPVMHLNAKEGLSLINGTSCMVAMACSVLYDAVITVKTADVIAATSIQALCGRSNPFDLRVHAQKYHPGQFATARNLGILLKGNALTIDEQELSNSLADVLRRMQGVKVSDIPMEDSYSIRCTPQVIGPTRDALHYACSALEREINSSNDNPLIFPDEDTFIHNGHFHGQCISLPMDQVASAMTVVGVISDRRIDRFMDSDHSVGLPPFLCREKTGIRMGLMGGQFMTSSLVAECRTLCVPASIQSVPSTADFQDIVSFGLIAGRKARDVVRNVCYILAFEALCAAQAADMRGVERLSKSGKVLYDAVRETIPYMKEDAVYIDALETLATRIRSGEFVRRVEDALGEKLWLVDESRS